MSTEPRAEEERAAVVAFLYAEAQEWWYRQTDEKRPEDERQRAAVRAMTITDLAGKIAEGAHDGQ